jgi:hypothetical protein
MYIYGCIIPEICISRVAVLAVAATPGGAADYGAPTRSSAIVFPTRQISKKIAEIFATRIPTLPCVQMYIIHFAHPAIHQSALFRAQRAADKKFPPAANGLKDSGKINSNPSLPIDAGTAVFTCANLTHAG